MARRNDERPVKSGKDRMQVGVDITTHALLGALAKYDGCSRVHVIRQLVRAAARSHYGTVEAALLEVRND